MPSDKYLHVAAIATIGHRLIASPSVDRFFGGCLPVMCITTGVPRVGQLLSFRNVIRSLPIISPKLGGFYLQWLEASIQYLPAQYLSAIFHLTCAFDKWMFNKLCLKGLSLGQNFIRNDLIRVIVSGRRSLRPTNADYDPIM